jgi:uracil-DNA glycosylase
VPKRPLPASLDPGWAVALEPVADHIAAAGDFLRAEIAASRSYLPAGPNVLRAFSQPFDEVRVLIVGQDPYPTPGHPIGLSFAVAADVRPLPRSLANIFKELQDDLGVPAPSSGDLTPWTRQGVLLLNRVLTVQPGKSGSHQGKGWEQVTEQAVRALAARDRPLVAILWGRQAQSLRGVLAEGTLAAPRSITRIESVHPSPLSASGGFFGSKPFSRANAALLAAGADPVDWQLP